MPNIEIKGLQGLTPPLQGCIGGIDRTTDVIWKASGITSADQLPMTWMGSFVFQLATYQWKDPDLIVDEGL